MIMPNPSSSTSSPHAERQYLHTMVAGALLPFAQATITALVIAVGTWVIAWLVFDMMDSYKAFILSFALTWCLVFIWLQRHWMKLTAIENIIQRDINNDGVIGEAKPEETPRRKITIDMSTISTDKGYSQKRIDLPGDEDQLIAFAHGVLADMPMSEKTWTGRGKPYSTQDFRDLMHAMTKHGLIEYINETDKRQGRRLTPTGRKFLEEVIADNSPPPQ